MKEPPSFDPSPPGWPPRPARVPQEVPRRPQEAPGRPPEGPKRPTRDTQDALRYLGEKAPLIYSGVGHSLATGREAEEPTSSKMAPRWPQ
eukprot:4564079-Pyramimonas_sp.AAC.1